MHCKISAKPSTTTEKGMLLVTKAIAKTGTVTVLQNCMMVNRTKYKTKRSSRNSIANKRPT